MLLCTYCLREKSESERSEEHVIPASLGGSWTVRNICKTCQEDVNVAVDRPFVQMLWVLEQRHRHQVPDRYGNVPEAPQVQGAVADGRRAILTMTREGKWDFRILPAVEEQPDGSLNLKVSADVEAEYLAKKLPRLALRTPGFRFEIRSRAVTAADEETFSFDFGIHYRLWPRFAVKVALNAGRELYGRDWLTEPHGLRLHEILWDRDTTTAMRPLATRKVPWESSGWSATPNHVLLAMEGTQGPMLLISLFGEDMYGVPLGPKPLPEQEALIVYTHEGRCERLALDGFWAKVISGSQQGQG